MKKFKLLVGLLGTALLVNPLVARADESEISVNLDGKYVDGRVYMPLRAAADGMGAATAWNQNTQTATVEKGGIKFEATVGPFVKVFNNRMYVQFREFNNTFFNQESINWVPDYLQAWSNHFFIQLAPLKEEEAVKLATNAISKKKEWQQFLQDTAGFNFQENVDWDGFDHYKATYYSEWNKKGDYYASAFEAKMKKSFGKWVIYSYSYQKSGMLPPH